MNDRHPSAAPDPSVPAPDAAFGHHPSPEQQPTPYGWGAYDTGQWDTTGQWGAAGHTQVWDFSACDTGPQPDWGQQAQDGTWATDAGAGPAGQWQWETTSSTGWGNLPGSDWHGDTSGQWDTGHSAQWDTTGQWDTGGQGFVPQQPQQPVDHAMTQAWDSSAWNQPAGGSWDVDHAAQTQTWDASAWAEAAQPAPPHDPTLMAVLPDPGVDPAPPAPAPATDSDTRTMHAVVVPPRDGEDERPAVPVKAASEGGDRPVRNRRKGGAPRSGYRPRRKALLTVAVPSVAVMGVAGVAAATVASNGQQDAQPTQAASAPDPSTVRLSAANSKLDTQLAGLSRGADDFATRANRTQERIDLRLRQDEERRRKAEEAARKEAERPKFALPVNQHGLSAYYGQAGVNWMSVHTGIDFPVSYGTPVMAATDGTVRTQYNVAYGNMAIVTAPDGTETWYCHLSSTRVRSGPVKAGDVIAYSGNSGNSTGPHLHFEVRPGGSAVDPLPWLRAHNLDPT
ncbi:M23 family metallopeptidase [Streptomyces sp. I05A-00742]|uniref:M23 family metallopeptidase n=1 Tax=Streptomyces sp. I05A-00742 TaxID=2732853 RepID=UPI00289BC40B|nr:M23 family metallopeptidase [Streptomyces sp. I05A-00742]